MKSSFALIVLALITPAAARLCYSVDRSPQRCVVEPIDCSSRFCVNVVNSSFADTGGCDVADLCEASGRRGKEFCCDSDLCNRYECGNGALKGDHTSGERDNSGDVEEAAARDATSQSGDVAGGKANGANTNNQPVSAASPLIAVPINLLVAAIGMCVAARR